MMTVFEEKRDALNRVKTGIVHTLLCPLGADQSHCNCNIATAAYPYACLSGLPTITRVFAVIAFQKFRLCYLFPPYFIACPLWVLQKLLISLYEVTIDGIFAFINRYVIAVVNDRPRHAAEY
jgi:hypothetical protein